MVNEFEFIKALLAPLLQAEDRRLQHWLDKIIRKQQDLTTKDIHCFIHGGVVYKPSWIGRGRWTHKPLEISLWPEFELWRKDKKVVEHDRSMIQQTLHHLLGPCLTNLEVRNALPECLVPPELKHNYERTRPEAYTIQFDDRHMRQYLKVLPRIEMYAAGRLLY